MIRGAITFLFLSAFSSSINAAVLHYDEAIDGDLYPTGGYIGTLDVGINTITGHASANEIIDLDAARVNLQENHQITGIFLDIFDLHQGTNNIFDVTIIEFLGTTWDRVYFQADDAQHFLDPGDQGLVILPAGSSTWSGSLFNSLLPLSGAEGFTFGNNSFQGLYLDTEYSYLWSIEVDYIVAPVPLPAAAWLFISGIFTLAGFTYRNKPN